MTSTAEQHGEVDGIPLHRLRLRDIERAAIERTLAYTGNNQSETARILGISRPTLLRKLKGYRLEDAAAQMHRSTEAAAEFNLRCWPQQHDRDQR